MGINLVGGFFKCDNILTKINTWNQESREGSIRFLTLRWKGLEMVLRTRSSNKEMIGCSFFFFFYKN